MPRKSWRKVGEVFLSDKTTLRVEEVDSASCDGCHFYDRQKSKCNKNRGKVGVCGFNERPDKKYVIFRKLETAK